MGVYALCEFMLAAGFDPDKRKKIRDLDGQVYSNSLTSIVTFEPILRLRDRIAGDALDAAMLGFGGGAALVALYLAAMHIVGGSLRRGRRLRGGELVTSGELARRALPLHRRVRRLVRRNKPGSYRIAGIPWPSGAETRHTIVSGTTGSGKTVLIADLVEQIRERGERCVIYDKMGSYTETFVDPARDVLLNPLDARAPRWSPFVEARTAREFDTMAAALIPRQKDAADPFWITAARQLFSHGAAVLWKRGETRNGVLVDHLLKTELKALAEAMEGTVAQSIVDPENPKTALSVRAMLTANIGAMDLLPDAGPSFSIREWIERDGGGFLFLTSRGDQHASLRGLISTWLEIAVNALLSLPRRDGRRTWLILDELPTLHQLPSLRPGLAESRQFGGCFVLGVQVFSALRDLYGRDGAETISGLCGTRVVLAAPDRDTSEWSAESLGRAEVETLAEGVSYDTGDHPGPPRDGVTLSARRDLRPLVLPAEVARLENLTGYLKFPGPWPVAQIRLAYKERRAVAQRFVPREDAGSGLGEPSRTAPHGAGPKAMGGQTIDTATEQVGDGGEDSPGIADVVNAMPPGAAVNGETEFAEASLDDSHGEISAGWHEAGWAPHEWALCDGDDEIGTPAGARGCGSEEGAGAGNGASTGGAGSTNRAESNTKDRGPTTGAEDSWLPFGAAAEKPATAKKQHDDTRERSIAEGVDHGASGDGGGVKTRAPAASTDGDTEASGDDGPQDEAGKRNKLPPGWIPL